MNEGDVWHSPTARSRFKVVERSAERLTLEFENEVDDIGPPEHLHPGQDEVFTVLDGELLVQSGGKHVRLQPGQSHRVPRGVAHTFRNVGSARVRFTSQHLPALGFERFLKTIYDLDRDGRSNAPTGTQFSLRYDPNDLTDVRQEGSYRVPVLIVGSIGLVFLGIFVRVLLRKQSALARSYSTPAGGSH